MSSILGSKQSGQQTSTTTPYSGIYADWLTNQYNNANARAGTTQGYTGQLNYGVTPGQENALSSLKNLQGNDFLTKAASGYYLDPASNPYAQKTFQSGVTDIMKQYGQARNNMVTNLAKSGGLNSSARTNLESKLLNDSQGQAMRYQNDFYNQLYNTGLNTTTNAISQLQGIGKDVLSGESLLQGINQEGLNRQAEDYWKAKGYNQQDINNIISILSLAKNPSTTTETTTQNHGLFK